MSKLATEAPVYRYDAATDTHTMRYPDGTRLEASRVALDPYDRLNGDVSAFGSEGDTAFLNRSYGNLLDDRFKQSFADGCQRMDGAVAWLPRLITLGDALAQAVIGTTQSARDYWNETLTVPEFLALDLGSQVQSLVPDMIYPGCITFVVSPRGLGKSNMAIALALALAQGGRFREAPLAPARVLLLDRDNPPSLVQQRLRKWGGATAIGCQVRTRNHVPPLTDRAKWKAFPAETCDVLILDSFLASTEGVTEKESKQFTQALAVIKDLAHRGPGILVLHNTIKSAEHYRGRGELADTIDILYEVRDATHWLPLASGEWWESLPDAGEKDWAKRATRRQDNACLRLAFIASKFRLGLEPKPFILEIDLRVDPWTLREVTRQVIANGKQAAQAAARAEVACGSSSGSSRRVGPESVVEHLCDGPRAGLRQRGVRQVPSGEPEGTRQRLGDLRTQTGVVVQNFRHLAALGVHRLAPAPTRALEVVRGAVLELPEMRQDTAQASD
jgi:hypothetical protein